MNSANSVLIEIQSPSIVKIINTLDLFKQNQVSFSIIEDNMPQTKPINPIFKSKFKNLLGRNGLDVLRLLSEGYTYEDIATELDITIDGVRYYIKKIFNALGVNNGRDAVRIYLTKFKENYQ